MRCRSECATSAATFLGMSQTLNLSLNLMLERLACASFGVEISRLQRSSLQS
jgi:hypothetical protein